MLIKRPINSGVHSGQIAFPGGKSEDFDESHWHTATREAEEEVGIKTDSVNLIGELTSLIIPVSNFMVHPFIGFVNKTPDFIANPNEVHQLVPVPLTELVNMPIHSKLIETSYGKIEAPYFSLQQHDIWGATAMIISEFNHMLNPALNR
jgi:8-oxo-dGTP pyrophosphatase MutT (NUDIX family)